jgi:hypothetical protein
MNKKEQYSLIFFKRIRPDGKLRADLRVENTDNSTILNLLGYLDENATVGFIDDLESCIYSKRNVDEGFQFDHFGDTDVLYKYPNVTFGTLYSIPMIDLKEILEEWLVFLKSS